MNRLNCVLHINVPCRMTSNAVRLFHQQTKGVHRKHNSEERLLKSTRFLSSRRRNCDCRSFHCAIHQPRYKSRSSRALSKHEQKHRSFSNQLTKSLNSKGHIIRSNEKSGGSIREVKASKFYGTGMLGGLTEKEPRTYAQIIASYNESMYSQCNSDLPRDSINPVLPNGIRRSPFSTASVVSLKWSGKETPIKVTRVRSTVSNTYNQIAKFSSDSLAKRNEQDLIGPKYLERTSSYATMIEKYSTAMNVGICCRNWKSNIVPRRNVSTSELREAPSMVLLDTKSTDGAPQDVSMSNFSKSVAGNVTEEATKHEIEKETDWVTKLEDIIKDLKEITAKKDALDAATKSNEKWILQSVNERAQWLDRVVSAHKKSKDEDDTLAHSKLNDIIHPEESLWKSDSTILQTAQMSTTSDKPSSPISDYIRRGPVSSNTPSPTQKSTSQTPSNTVTNPPKEPQIELRMTPSQNESVVSINVDELAAKTAGSSATDQLSVVISSKKNRAGTVDPSNLNLHSDFGSMQISISEDTVPVKQIEFSINGKPVSELKSIVARADKLDVVSSMDKVEIRIPSSKDSGKLEQTSAASVSKSKPVLNLQIAAKFNEPRVQQPKSTGVKPETSTPPPTHVPPPSSPPTQKIFKTTPVGNISVTNAPTSIPKEETVPNVADRGPSTVNIPSQISAWRSPGHIPYQPQINANYISTNESTENRTPSAAIPWWSSEASFKKIKKRQNDQKNVPVPDDNKEEPKEAESKLNVRQKVEEKKSDGALNQQNVIDTLKKVTPAKGVVVQKQVVEENERSADLPGSVLRVIHVQNSPEWVPFTPSSGVKSSKSKGALKEKHRVKSIDKSVSKSASLRRESNASTISSATMPKLVKDEHDNAKKATMNEEREAGRRTTLNTKANEQQVQARKIEVSKGSVSQTGKEFAQRSKTVLKKTNDLEKPANRSADVSANSTSSATEHSFEVARGKKEDKVDETIAEKKEVSSEKIQEIFKSMKPIEKRKDGTLIDYGVTVPSRNPMEKFENVPRMQRKIPINVEPEKVVTETAPSKGISSQVKIVEPEKQSLPKEQTQRKSISEQEKIIEPEQIISVKKSVEASGVEIVKLDKSGSKLQFQKVTNENVAEKRKNDQKPIARATNIHTEKHVEVARFSETNKSLRKLDTKVTGKFPLEGTIVTKLPETVSKTTEIDNSETSISRSIPKPKAIPYENTVTPSWVKIIEKKESKNKVTKPKRASSHPAKKVSNMISLGSAVSRAQKSSVNIVKKENAPFLKSNPRVDEKLSNTGTAPFEGTINYEGSRKQDDQSRLAFSNVTEKKVDSETVKGHETNLSPKLNVMTSNKSEDDTDPSGPVCILTGPAGLEQKSRSFTITQATSNAPVGYMNEVEKLELNENNTVHCSGESNQNYVLLSNTVERPEKNILYSAWLQRNKSEIDDDKTM